MFCTLPLEVQCIVLRFMTPWHSGRPHKTAEIIKQGSNQLKYIRQYMYTEVYKFRIWESLRPSQLNSLFYGGDSGAVFIIERTQISKGEQIRINNNI
jgi:hypothetical protein